MRRLPTLDLALVGLATTLITTGAVAGPWSQLPDAVERLEVSPEDSEAWAVLDATEASLETELAAGRLAAAQELLAVYEELVIALPAGDVRVDELRQRAAAMLVAAGDALIDRDVDGAARRWAMASRLDDRSGAGSRLRPLVLPPVDPSPGDRWVSAADDVELVWLPAKQSRVGCSTNDRLCRGDEVFFRYVSVPGFWLEAVEVTNRRYRRCVEAAWCRPPVDRVAFDDPERDEEPVVWVDWDRAVAFAAWAGRRLPTEAEWERAARDGDDRRRFPWGFSRTRVEANVWVEGRFADPYAGLSPVASFEPSPLGLFDLAGNVWEWCADRYAVRLLDLPDDGSQYRGGDLGRVLRGGSWRRTVELARVSSRTWQDHGYASDDVGLRCALDPVTQASAAQVGEIARRVWPLTVDGIRPLDRAALDAQDRLYLERRAMTWLMLEERYDLALPRAVALLESGQALSVARDLVSRVERLILDFAGDDRVGDLRPVLLAYRDATEGHDDLLADRRRDLLQRVTRRLRSEGQRLLNAGDTEAAAARFRLALDLSQGDALLERSFERTMPTPGTVATWVADGREMVWIPGGEVRIGASVGDTSADADEHPARVVEVEGFWIDRREVTNRDYRRCVDAGLCTAPSESAAYDDPNRANHPVLFVTWYQARSYAKWAGKRLPTETEWERAARAGSATPYPWGLLWETGRCNSAGAEGADRWGAAAPVAAFPASRWQTFDLIGNAAEWVADLYHRDYRGAPRDGRAWNQLTGGPTDRERVVRGGGWTDQPQRLRVSHRTEQHPDESERIIGFRCAVDASALVVPR